MIYENAKYITNINGEKTIVNVKINNVEWNIPMDPANVDYQEICRLVEAGELTIAEPENI